MKLRWYHWLALWIVIGCLSKVMNFDWLWWTIAIFIVVASFGVGIYEIVNHVKINEHPVCKYSTVSCQKGSILKKADCKKCQIYIDLESKTGTKPEIIRW
jgi:hypothetical protein